MSKPTPNIAWPFPDHRHLYLLTAGILLGVLLGPAVLGQVRPQWHDRLFVGSQKADAELRGVDTQIKAYEDETRALIQKVVAVFGERDSSAEAEITSLVERRRPGLEALYAQRLSAEAKLQLNRTQHDAYLQGLLLAIVMAVVAVMLIEAWTSPTPAANGTDVPPRVARLLTARYALTALGLALLLAQPDPLRQLPWLFTAALLAVAMAAAFVPLGKRR